MRILHWKKRPFMYAAVISVGFLFLINTLQNFPIKYFFISALILYLILLFELFSTKFFSEQLLQQFSLLSSNDQQKQKIYSLHQLILPTTLYLSLLGFIFFHHQSNIEFFTLSLVLILFFILFNNIRAHFENKYLLEQHTSGIYDMISLISIYLYCDTVINIFIRNNWNTGFLPIALIIIVIFYLGLCLIRMEIISLKILQIAGIIYFSIFIILEILVLFLTNLFTFSIITTLLFYYSLAFFHHWKDNSFTKSIIAEYIVVFFILLVLLNEVF
ncbi:MAG: hypothetical protein WCJ58_06480 [bacterium]